MDSAYKTAEGVYAGMLVADAEMKYGKVKSIYNDAHIGETGEFTNQSQGFNFIFTGKKSAPADYSPAGVYNTDRDGKTSKYTLGSYISSISISNFDEDKPTRIPEFTSVYSNFTTDCKLVDEEG